MNSNRFRQQYRVLSPVERERVDLIKDQAEALAATIESMPDGREKALALTRLEESVMWAVKGATG